MIFIKIKIFYENVGFPMVSLSGSPGGHRASGLLQECQESRRATYFMTRHHRATYFMPRHHTNTIEPLRSTLESIYTVYTNIYIYGNLEKTLASARFKETVFNYII